MEPRQHDYAYVRREPISWPHLVGVVPPQADCYQVRQVGVDLSTDPAGTVVLTGLGGVGKTQLAAQLSRDLFEAGDLDLLVWVSAVSRHSIVATYAQVAGDLEAGRDDDAEDTANRFLTWLRGTDRRWLIVLDDVTDPGDLRGLWPPAGAGRVLLTTRRRDAVMAMSGRRLVSVDHFTPVEAEAYLSQKLDGPADRLGEAGLLAADLGYLPLALAQAAAYMQDRSLDCAAYRHRLRDQRHRLADLLPEQGALPDEHRATVAATWSLSVELANGLHPVGLARPLLDLASILDPAGIPAAVFASPAALAYLSRVSGGDVDADSSRDSVHCLHRLSLVSHDPDSLSRTVRVHALVQRVAREHLDPKGVAAIATVAAESLTQAWPDIERDPALGQALRANAAAVDRQAAGVDRQADALVKSAAGRKLLFRAGQSLGEAGHVAAAIIYWRRLRLTAEQPLGPDHDDMLVIRDNIGRYLGEAGDPAGAVAEFTALLADRMRLSGPDHPDTLDARNALAFWQGEAGDVTGALESLGQLVSDYHRVLGPDRRDSLIARNNLAYWQGVSGDPAGAVTALEALVSDFERVLGPDHADTLNARNNLAYWRGGAGDAAAAAVALTALLDDCLRVLGPDHPQTLAIRANLARRRGEAGDPAGAAAALTDLLADRLRVLGPDHPETLITRDNLAFWQGEAGDASGAAAAFAELLTDYLRVLGPDHPETLATRRSLARWRGQAGDVAQAVADFEALLGEQTRVLGPYNPDTLTTRHNLAAWRGEIGDPAATLAALQDVLADRLRVLGPDHPDTLANRHAIAWWRGRAGEVAEAIAAFEDLLTDRIRVLGPDHPHTLTTRHAQAYWRGKTGAPIAAELGLLLEDRTRILGAAHPDTLATRRDLAGSDSA